MNPNKQELSRTLANSLYQKCGEGYHYNSSFETPKWGFLVTIEMGPSYENAISVNTQGVARFIEKNLGKVHHPIFFFSVRTDKNGMVHFDLREQCANEGYAYELAQEKGQDILFSVEDGKELVVSPQTI